MVAPSKPRVMSNRLRLSIIIPTYNRSRYLIQTVEQVCEQSFQGFELWVVDQSDDDQAEINRTAIEAMSDSRINYFRCAARGVANARNEGLVRADGEIIIFLDDDVVLLNNKFLDAHVQAYADPSVGGVTGRTVERLNKENARQTTNRVTRGGRTLVNLLGTERCQIHGLKGANMSVRAAAARMISGFDRNYIGTALLEEADFSERIMSLGWRLAFEPNAELLHLSAPAGGVRVANDAQTAYYRFRSTAYFIRKHRGRTGLIPFAITHSLIGLKLAMRHRDSSLLIRVAAGALDGLRRLHEGTDENLPSRET